MNRFVWMAVPASLLAAAPLAAAETRQHDVHVHGVAELDVAVLGSHLEMALLSPAMNIVGFEHEPRTDEQARQLETALETLRAPERVFRIPEAAECGLESVRVQRVAGSGDGPEDDAHDAHEHEEHGHDEHAGSGKHAEIRAHYRFRCGDRDALDAIEVRLLERFPRTERIRVQLITDTAQRALTLEPGTARIEP